MPTQPAVWWYSVFYALWKWLVLLPWVVYLLCEWCICRWHELAEVICSSLKRGETCSILYSFFLSIKEFFLSPISFILKTCSTRHYKMFDVQPENNSYLIYLNIENSKFDQWSSVMNILWMRSSDMKYLIYLNVENSKFDQWSSVMTSLVFISFHYDAHS